MKESELSLEAQHCLQKLLRIWFEFERDLNRVPIIKRLEHGQFSLADYQALLLNLRQQVIEGSRWIARGASGFDRAYADVRSLVIGHAHEEHRDYEMLERDFVKAGGALEAIQTAERNDGSEALHAYMMFSASKDNPINLIGAMWDYRRSGTKDGAKLGRSRLRRKLI